METLLQAVEVVVWQETIKQLSRLGSMLMIAVQVAAMCVLCGAHMISIM